MGLTLVGLGLFLSTFFSFCRPQAFFEDPEGAMGSYALRGVSGFVLILVGQWLRRLGARGLAGSGVLLDPERARRDLEPYSRMVGGMVGDALSEVRLDFAQPPAVMLRCRSCQRLNEEDSKFCQECGKEL